MTEGAALSDRSFDRDVKSITERFAIGQTDENRASNWRVPGSPRFVSSFVIKLYNSLSTLVSGLNTLSFDLIGSSNFYSEH